MRRSTQERILASLAFAGWMLLASGASAGAAGGAVFELEERLVHIPEQGKVRALTLQADTNTFQLIPPRNWGLRFTASQRLLSFLSEDLKSSMEIRFLEAADLVVRPGDAESASRVVRMRYPLELRVAQFDVPTGMGMGRNFDSKLISGTGVVFRTRVILLPVDDRQVVEFRFMAPETDVERQRHYFQNLLNSFKRVDPPKAVE